MKRMFILAAALACVASMKAQTPQTEVEAVCGDKVTIKAEPQYGYHFDRWEDDATAPATRQVDVSSSATYKAYFAPNEYTLTVLGDNGTVTGSGSFLYGSEQPITAVADECYHFVRWSNGDTNASTTIRIDGPTEVTAIFELTKFTIKVSSDDDAQGTVSVTK